VETTSAELNLNMLGCSDALSKGDPTVSRSGKGWLDRLTTSSCRIGAALPIANLAAWP
jgi:hypothetical protein